MSAFTDSEKVEVRRFCGFPAYGAAPSGMQSWRFYQTYGLLEYRLNNLSDPEMAVVRRHLATLIGLEAAIPSSGEHLDTDQAAVWSRNRDEVEDRVQLLAEWCRRLCAFLGVPPGPGLPGCSPTLIV